MNERGTPIRGVIAAAPTPTDASAALNVDAVAPLLDGLERSGCHGVLFLGSTGEGPSFDDRERGALLDAAEQWRLRRPSGAPSFAILAACHGTCASTVARRIQAAARRGVDAVLVPPPYYYRPAAPSGLVGWFEAVLRGVSADLPLFLYDIPRLTGNPLPMEVVGLLAEKDPRITGVKDSRGDLQHTLTLCRDLPRLKIFTGTDAHVATVLQAAGTGCITAGASVFGRTVREVWDAQEGHRDPTPAQQALTRQRDLLDRWGTIPAVKALAAERWGSEPWPPRPPLEALPNVEARAFLAAIATEERGRSPG